ncbi:MAG: exonuclease domain-containing protein [Candidatus Omnitrophica bacterium]|nr:exonuclease domain-containing protein [Candidatus Omnitrophota bacterium]
MSKYIDEVEFTIFDVETTGLEPEKGDRIIEIAGIRMRGDERLGVFHSLVESGKEVSAEAFAVNRITPEMLKDAPLSERVLPDFLNFSNGSVLASYNAPFDMGFLNNELGLINIKPPDSPVIDVLRMSRRLLPDLERYALCFVARELGIQTEQVHRALSDVELTVNVFKALRELLDEKGIDDFHNFASLFGLNCSLLENITNAKIARIQEAISLGVRLNIKYLSRTNARVTQRDILPKEIKKDKGQAYLVGACYLRNEERTFRIDGILHMEIV